MAMKPAGKAIMVAVVAAVVGGGIYFSGALNKLPQREAAAAQPVEVQAVPTPVTDRPAPAEAAPVIQAPVETANDAALDALISKGNKK